MYCGICHTDVVYAENKRGNTKFPLVPGHELAGIVTKVSGHTVHGPNNYKDTKPKMSSLLVFKGVYRQEIQ